MLRRKKKYFSAAAASPARQRPAQGMPGPQRTSLLPRSAPSQPGPPPAPRPQPAAAPNPALTSWGPASVAPPAWRRNVGLQRLLPPPPCLPLQPPPERCPARRRGWRLGARGIPGGAGPGRGGAAPREVAGARRCASVERAPRAQVVPTLPLGWVRAPGRREASAGRGRWGGSVFRAGRTGTCTGAREDRGKGAQGRDVCTARVARGGGACESAGVYSTLPSAAPA